MISAELQKALDHGRRKLKGPLNPVESAPGDDPNDWIDPDDSRKTEPVQCVLLLSPPTQNESWWTAVVLGSADAGISPQDALVALAHVAYRLGYARANRGTEPVMVGQLHEKVETLYGASGWAALVSLWQEAAGIQPPKRQPKPAGAPVPAAELASKPATPLFPLPASAPLLEEGLHRELEGMPVKVQAFFLHSPKEPAPWVYRESEGERVQREQLESEGCWTG